MSEANDQHAQNYHELGGEEARHKVAELIKGIRICMMATQGVDGSIDARPMAVEDKPFEGALWFLTRGSSEKVTEVQGDRHVTLSFSDPKDGKYITLKGRGTVTGDRAKVHELWNGMYKAWFPKGPDDPDVAALRVDIADGDYWEGNSSRIVRFAKIAVAAATGGSVATGESGHLTI